MKINSTTKVKVVVKGETYERYEEGETFDKTYEGTWEEVLNEISKVHSYGWVVGEDNGNGDLYSCEMVLENIVGTNGDGCDYIFDMSVEWEGEKKVLIENEFEEDID